MKLSTLLKQQSELIRNSSVECVAVDILKKAGMEDKDARTQVSQKLMEKAAVDHLVNTGIDYDSALEMVKIADVNLTTLKTYQTEVIPEEVISDQLLKAAELAEEMEASLTKMAELEKKVTELQAQLDEIPDTRTVSESITKFAASGSFTNEDLEALSKLPSELLNKVASSSDAPWGMGTVSKELNPDDLDPIARFCLS
jgi:hypothetical protein